MTATILAQPRAAALDLACALLSIRLGRWEAWAQREAAPSPVRVERPGPGELVLHFRRWSLAMHRCRDAARAAI